MKRIVLTLIFTAMCLDLISQNSVYDFQGTKKTFKSEDIDIEFTQPKTAVQFPKPVVQESALLSALPTIVDVGFQIITDILEKRVKKFTAEYTKSRSYLGAGNRTIPDIKFYRKIGFGGNETEALSICMKVYKLKNMPVSMPGFVYYIESINLKYSSAKATSKNNTFDYIILLKPTFLINNEKKIVELNPVTVSSVHFNNDVQYPEAKHRTDIIFMPAGTILTEMSIKVIESNPVKARAEKILSIWKTYKDSTKTIINNFLPEEKKPDLNNAGGNSPTTNKPQVEKKKK